MRQNRTVRKSVFYEFVPSRFMSELHTDAMSLVRAVRNTLALKALASGRRREDVEDLRESVVRGELEGDVWHIQGTVNPLDAISKPLEKVTQTVVCFRKLLENCHYEPAFT